MRTVVIFLVAPTVFTLIGASCVFLGFLLADLLVYGRWP